MAESLFELGFLGGAALRRMEKQFPNMETDYPWDSLDPSNYPDQLIERARLGWTENTLNEYCATAAMGKLVQILVEANAPVDLIAMASEFAKEEILHVILCSRVTMILGGGAAMAYDPKDMVFQIDESLSPLQKANEMVLKLCCVSEAFSFPMLRGQMQAAAHPLTKAVLKTIVQDERHHGILGFMYLDWVKDQLDDAEKQRLGRLAKETAEEFHEIWERLRTSADIFHDLSPQEQQQYHEMGWMAPSQYITLAEDTLQKEVFEKLAAYGIQP